MAERLLVWRGVDSFRAEVAHVRVEDTRLTASGTQLGVEPTGYRLDYQLETGDEYVTSTLDARASGVGWERRLLLRRRADGDWECEAQASGDFELPDPGGEAREVRGALDCDIGFSPLTNTMPVLRHRLHEGGDGADFTMAWVSVPDLSLHRSEQRYEHVRRSPHEAVVRYIGRDHSFVGELLLDRDGFVERYPGLAERIWPGPSGGYPRPR